MPELGEPLSGRELEVLQCLSRGAGNKEIAAELFISENTVKVHLRNIYTKLGTSTRTEAATVALQQGVIVMPGVDTPVAPVNENVLESEAVVAVNNGTTPAIPAAALAGHRWLNWRTGSLLVAAVLLLVVAAAVLSRTILVPAADIPESFTPVDLGENWKGIRSLPEPRSHMASAAIGLNMYVIGGETVAGVDNQVLVYHTINHTWEEAAAKPTAVSDATAVALFGIIYVPGGRQADGQPTSLVEAYSPTNNSWHTVQSLPHPIAGGLALSDGSLLYLIGGWDGREYLNSTYVYDPVADGWQPLPPMSQARARLAGGVVKGQLFAVGGENGQTELAVCEYFDPAAAAWNSCPDMLSPRAGAGGASVVNKLYIIGGMSAGQVVLFSEVFEPTEATWRIVNTPTLGAGNWHDLGVTNVETRIFALGGRRDAQLLAESYLYAPLVYQTFIPAASSGGE